MSKVEEFFQLRAEQQKAPQAPEGPKAYEVLLAKAPQPKVGPEPENMQKLMGKKWKP